MMASSPQTLHQSVDATESMITEQAPSSSESAEAAPMEVEDDTDEILRDFVEEASMMEPTPNSINPVILPFEYPVDIPFPSKTILNTLYDEAVDRSGSEQKSLMDYGLLSFQDVLLPAVGHLEERAVKRLQSLVLRDCREMAPIVVFCQKAIRDSIFAGAQAAKTSWECRLLNEAEREKEWAEQCKLKEEQKRQMEEKLMKEQAEMYDVERQVALNEARKNLPFNQDLYRETAYLLSELPKCQKEIKLWSQAAEEMKKQEEELDVLENEIQAGLSPAEESVSDVSGDDDGPVELLQTIERVTISSWRVQILLENVSNIVTTSDECRKELYRQYRKDHFLPQYPGASDPKGLLYALSLSLPTQLSQPSDA